MSVGSIIATHVGTKMKALTKAADGTTNIVKGGSISKNVGTSMKAMMGMFPEIPPTALDIPAAVTPKHLGNIINVAA